MFASVETNNNDDDNDYLSLNSSGDNNDSTQRNYTEKMTLNKNDDKIDNDDAMMNWDDKDINDFELPRLSDNNKTATGADQKDSRDDSKYGDEYWKQNHKGASSAGSQNEILSSTGEFYLTKQFRFLNTPGSKKKPRCIECTRPLPNKCASRICEKCVSS